MAVETPRGFRIAEEKASKKLDAIVALSMACVAALDFGGRILRMEDLFVAQDLRGPAEVIDELMAKQGEQEIEAGLINDFRSGRAAGGTWH